MTKYRDELARFVIGSIFLPIYVFVFKAATCKAATYMIGANHEHTRSNDIILVDAQSK